jgi:hypothetical protein
MTDTTDKALDALQSLIRHNMQWVGLQDVDREAYQQADDSITALRCERDAAIAREKALLASNQEERTALVETASLRRERDALRSQLATARADALREIEDMHEREWSRLAEAGQLDDAVTHRKLAMHMRALIDTLSDDDLRHDPGAGIEAGEANVLQPYYSGEYFVKMEILNIEHAAKILEREGLVPQIAENLRSSVRHLQSLDKHFAASAAPSPEAVARAALFVGVWPNGNLGPVFHHRDEAIEAGWTANGCSIAEIDQETIAAIITKAGGGEWPSPSQN